MRIAIVILLGFLTSVQFSHAEIEKFAIPGKKGLNLHWWPKLPVIPGWHQDREHSLRYSSNALVPDGYTFANAEAVMYARAIYKPREPGIKSLQMLIENDKQDFLANAPGITINETGSLVTADGKTLRSFTFFPKGQGNWERVSYGEEGEFYLIFSLSSRSLAGYEAAVTVYGKLIGLYKEKP
jgi:hypothetical protein